MSKLIDRLPREFGQEFTDTRAWELRDIEVVREVDAREHPWPGPHKNVMVWFELITGHLVGWNESPTRGWSFPVMKAPTPGVREEL